ncbi:MAG: putative small lipoprotein YifL [Alteromonadaceae bacterium]|jgi:predicted small lipoprotein YifL
MYKQNSIIFVYLVFLLVISGCGVKGPLYQTAPAPESTQQEKPVKDNKHDSSNHKEQGK